MPTQQTIETYMSAWNETDEGKRRQMLETVWADGGTYTDPMSHAAGVDELVTLISNFHKQMPGAGLAITTKIDEHHNRLRFGWKMTGPMEVEGIDVGALTEDGRIQSIVGFFGPLE